MKRARAIAIAFFVAVLLALAPSRAQASEGTAQLTSPSGDKARCFVTSILMENRTYKVVASCRDLIYPPASDLFAYLLWVEPPGGGRTQRLGELGVGKAEFTTQNTFSELFVTAEPDKGIRLNPSNRVIMRGSIQRIDLLEGSAPQPTPTQAGAPAESFGELIEQPTPTPTPTPQPGGIFATLRRAGIIFFVAIFVVLLILAAITRARG